MKKRIWTDIWNRRGTLGFAGAWGTVALAGALLCGCRTVQQGEATWGPVYAPQNVHYFSPSLPYAVRRVALLPMTSDGTQVEMESGRAVMDAAWREELGKMQRFEVIPVSEEQLRNLTGRRTWTAEERLPADFFKRLLDELGCEAVMFCRLTQFRAYPPLAVGVSAKLVEGGYPRVLWAVDEVLDAADPAVVTGARRYQHSQEQLPAALSDSRKILNSPWSFGRYAASVLLATLPER